MSVSHIPRACHNSDIENNFTVKFRVGLDEIMALISSEVCHKYMVANNGRKVLYVSFLKHYIYAYGYQSFPQMISGRFT